MDGFGRVAHETQDRLLRQALSSAQVGRVRDVSCARGQPRGPIGDAEFIVRDSERALRESRRST